MAPRTYVWKTASVIRETGEAVTVVFDTGGLNFSYKPGQFVNVRLVIDSEAVSRSYSLSSSPCEDERPSITVKRIEGGLMSQYIFHHAEEIQSWFVEGPYGSFCPSAETLQAAHVVLIAGGSGITPVFSILKYLLQHTSSKLYLIYSNKSWENTIFKSVLLYIENVFPGRFKAQFVFTEKGGAGGCPKKDHLVGRLSRLVLKKLINKELGGQVTNAHYFICGPAGLIQTAEETLGSLNVENRSVYKEHFTAPEEENKALVLPDEDTEVLFHFYEQTVLLNVNPGKTILDAALEDRIGVRYSCKSGTCGVCVAKLNNGQVHMRKNFALSEEQVQEGLVLLCQAHPLTNDVTVEVDA